MNREIKFRAWDKKYRKMIYEGFHIIGEVTVFNLIGEYLAETKTRDNISTVERWNDIELSQFTGLKDKNGKEIYEGDIAEEEIFTIIGDSIGKIKIIFEWENAGFIKRVLDSRGGIGFITENMKSELAKVPISEAGKHCNIIGNVYENQNLLE